MLILESCPRCLGDVYRASDGKHACLQCTYEPDLATLEATLILLSRRYPDLPDPHQRHQGALRPESASATKSFVAKS